MNTALPHIAGLDWTPDGAILTAPATKPFWDRYYNTARRSRIIEIGISIKKTDAWHVRFDPGVVSAETVLAVSKALCEEVFAEELEASERRAVQERAELEGHSRR